jgi:hypothetical protein
MIASHTYNTLGKHVHHARNVSVCKCACAVAVTLFEGKILDLKMRSPL